MKKLRTHLPILLLLATAAASLTAKADTLTVTGVGAGTRGVPLTAGSEWAVQILITINGIPHTAFCVDLFTNIGFASYNTTPSAPATFHPFGPRLAWIYHNYANLVPTSPNPDLAATALQLALWDIRHDDGDGLDTGVIQLVESYRTTVAGAALLAAADEIINASIGKRSTQASILYNFSFDGNPAQTLITDGNWPEPTPEPSTFLLLGAGFAGCFGVRRWRNRQGRVP